jgi:hypothetical protein
MPDFVEGKRVKKKVIKADSSKSPACAAVVTDSATCLENAPHFSLPVRRAKMPMHAEMKAKVEMERQAAAAAMRLKVGSFKQPNPAALHACNFCTKPCCSQEQPEWVPGNCDGSLSVSGFCGIDEAVHINRARGMILQ